MVSPNPRPAAARDLSLADLAERLTCEVESTGSLDFEHWIEYYSDWEPVIEELGSLLQKLFELGESMKPGSSAGLATPGAPRGTDGGGPRGLDSPPVR